jgi:hypothetical protein
VANGMGSVFEKREKCSRFWWESPYRSQIGSPSQRLEGIRMDIRETGWGMLSGSSWLSIRACVGLLGIW